MMKLLRDALIRLYDSAKDAERVARDAGLDLAKLDLSGSLLNQWDEILRKAEKQDKIHDIYKIAAIDYPKDQDLKSAHTAYQQTIKQVKPPQEADIPPSDNKANAHHISSASVQGVDLQNHNQKISVTETYHLPLWNWVLEHVKWIFSGIGVLIITLLISYFSASNNTPASNFYLSIKVIDRHKQNESVSSAEIHIETGGELKLPARRTGQDGLTRIEIPGSYRGKLADLVVHADGYKTFNSDIDLEPNDLPIQVILTPIPTIAKTPEPRPTASLITNETEVPNPTILPTDDSTCETSKFCILVGYEADKRDSLVGIINNLTDTIKSEFLNLAIQQQDIFVEAHGYNDQMQFVYLQREDTSLKLWVNLNNANPSEPDRLEIRYYLNEVLSFVRNGKTPLLPIQPLGPDISNILFNCVQCSNFSKPEQQNRLRAISQTAIGLVFYAHYDFVPATGVFTRALTLLDTSIPDINNVTRIFTCSDETSVQTTDEAGLIHLLYYYHGKSLIFQEHYQQGITHLFHSTRYVITDPAPWISIANAYQAWLSQDDSEYKSNQIAQALTCAEKFIEKLSSSSLTRVWDAGLYYNSGVVAEMRGNFPQAIQMYQQAIDNLPEEASSTWYKLQISRALAQKRAGLIQDAITTLDKAKSRNPQLPWAYLELADLHKMDNPTQTQQLLEQALNQTAKEIAVHVRIAQVYENWGKYQLAEQTYQNIRKQFQESNLPEPRLLLQSIALFYTPTNEEAIFPHQNWEIAEIFLSQIMNSSKDPWLHEKYAFVLYKQAKFADAANHYQQAIALLPSEANLDRLYCNLGLTQQNSQIGGEQAKRLIEIYCSKE